MTWITVITGLARFAFISFGLILTVTLASCWITDPCSYIGVPVTILIENIGLACFFVFTVISFHFLLPLTQLTAF